MERSSPDNAVIVEWSSDGRAFRELWSWRGDGTSGWTPIWEKSVSGATPFDTNTFFLRFRFAGENGQLWADWEHPGVLQVELADTGQK